jgi:flavin-binding protein dodecin
MRNREDGYWIAAGISLSRAFWRRSVGIRDAELDDPDASRHPRSKASDDAAAITCDLTTSSDDAVQQALAEARQTLRNIKAVDVVSTGLRGDDLDEWRAHVRVAFLVERVPECRPGPPAGGPDLQLSATPPPR